MLSPPTMYSSIPSTVYLLLLMVGLPCAISALIVILYNHELTIPNFELCNYYFMQANDFCSLHLNTYESSLLHALSIYGLLFFHL